MSNYFLSKDKQIAVTAALAEGNSIRSIERMTGIHRDTIMRLGVRIGQGCARLLDEKMRGLECKRIQIDELWGFVGKKQVHLSATDDPNLIGDVWTFCSIDADSKLVPNYKVGKRDKPTTRAFISDLHSRLKNRIQLSSDAFTAYELAIDDIFGENVEYGQIVKSYKTDGGKYSPERKYSPGEVVSISRFIMTGNPERYSISTSYVERLNASTRLHMKRLNRLTLAFSKKRENFEAAVGLHFAAYNLVRPHTALKMTPAMAAGIERSFWSYGDLVEAVS